MKSVRLISCDDFFEAYIIKGRLDNEEIPCYIVNENFSSLLPYLKNMLGGGLQVMVSESDYKRAIDLIHEETGYEKQNSKKQCPSCGSQNIGLSLGNNKIKKILAIIISLFAFIPIGNIYIKKHCKNCGEEFDSQ